MKLIAETVAPPMEPVLEMGNPTARRKLRAGRYGARDGAGWHGLLDNGTVREIIRKYGLRLAF